MPALLPNATWVSNPRNGGGTYAPEPTTRWKILIHEIQGDDRLEMIRTHPAPPHTWYDWQSRDHHQTIPLNRSAFALYHYPGRRETNKALVLQVEIAGFSSSVPDEPLHALTNIAVDVIVPFCGFVAERGAQINLRNVSGPFSYPSSASEHHWQRMSDAQFQAFDGITGHAWAPQNDHWDPGAMDLPRIAAHAALIIGGMLSAGTFSLEDDMATLINDGGTIWATNGVVKIAKTNGAFLLAEIQAGVYGDPNRWTHNGQLAIPPHPNAYAVIKDAMTVDEWTLAAMPDRIGQVLGANLPVLAPMVAKELAKPGMLPKPEIALDINAVADAITERIDMRALASVIVEQLLERAARQP